MKEFEFGKLVEKLIYFSGQKNYSLASALGYDMSYISKWINSTMLPAAKNIKVICKKIANFTVNSSSDSSIDEMISYFEVSVEEDTDKKDALCLLLEKKLNEAYNFSNNKNNKKSVISIQGTMENSILEINPRLRKVRLEDRLGSVKDEKSQVSIVLLANLFALSKEDKSHLVGIREGHSIHDNNPNVKMKFMISIDDNIDKKDIVYNTMLLVSMINTYSGFDFDVYSCNFKSSAVLVGAKNTFSHIAMYGDNGSCIFSNTSTDKKVTSDMYDTLENMRITQSKPTFRTTTLKEMISERRYIQYIIGDNLKWYIGNITDLFMPSDLFFEIGKQVFGDSEEVMHELRNIDTILQNATYRSRLQIIMHESKLRTYISTGKMSFFNVPIKLNIDQRQRHIEYMEKIFRENEDIKIKLVQDNLVEDFKYNKDTSIYLSNNVSYLKQDAEDRNKEGEYLIVKDKKMDKMFKQFFDEVWENDKYSYGDSKEETLSNISNMIAYARILSKNI